MKKFSSDLFFILIFFIGILANIKVTKEERRRAK